LLFIVESLRLIRNPEQYVFLRNSGCTQVDGIDDKEAFRVTRVSKLPELNTIKLN